MKEIKFSIPNITNKDIKTVGKNFKEWMVDTWKIYLFF